MNKLVFTKAAQERILEAIKLKSNKDNKIKFSISPKACEFLNEYFGGDTPVPVNKLIEGTEFTSFEQIHFTGDMDFDWSNFFNSIDYNKHYVVSETNFIDYAELFSLKITIGDEVNYLPFTAMRQITEESTEPSYMLMWLGIEEMVKQPLAQLLFSMVTGNDSLGYLVLGLGPAATAQALCKVLSTSDQVEFCNFEQEDIWNGIVIGSKAFKMPHKRLTDDREESTKYSEVYFDIVKYSTAEEIKKLSDFIAAYCLGGVLSGSPLTSGTQENEICVRIKTNPTTVVSINYEVSGREPIELFNSIDGWSDAIDAEGKFTLPEGEYVGNKFDLDDVDYEPKSDADLNALMQFSSPFFDGDLIYVK